MGWYSTVRCAMAGTLVSWACVVACAGTAIDDPERGGHTVPNDGSGGAGNTSTPAGGADSGTGLRTEPSDAGGRRAMVRGSGGAAEIYDAGPVPSRCPARDIPTSTSVTPGPGDIPGEITVKFISGTHLRIVDGALSIDESTSSSDPEFLRCTGLTLAGAKAALVPINRLMAGAPLSSIARLFTSNTDAVLGLYFLLRIDAAHAPELLAALRESPLVNIAYYSPRPAPPP
jgi:hypothetical protein